MALPTLLAVAALGFDMGLLSLAACQVQDVADATALAAAAELPDTTLAVRSLQPILDANNETSTWQVEVDLDRDLRYLDPGEELPGHGRLGVSEYAVEVTATIPYAHSFARIVGLEQTEVTRRAVALATVDRGSSCVLFAGETDPTRVGIQISGSSIRVHGGIHSNTKVKLQGAQNLEVTDGVEYLHECTLPKDSGIQAEVSVTKPYPVDFTWADFDRGEWDYRLDRLNVNAPTVAPGRYRVYGDMVVGGTNFSCHDCLFVVDGSIVFDGCSPALDRVTLVARGPIRFDGAVRRVSPFMDGLFAMSLYSTDGSAVQVGGAGSSTRGIIYAPDGGVTYNGSGQDVCHGMIAGRTVRINAAKSSFSAPDGDGAGRTTVRLVR